MTSECRGIHKSSWRPDLGYWVCSNCGLPLDERRRPRTPAEPPDGFKQATPLDELEVLYQSLWGNTSNFQEGVIDTKRYSETMVGHCRALEKLMPFIRKGSW